jgi:hypothetical protein
VKLKKKYNEETEKIIKSRDYFLMYEPQLFSRTRGVYTTLTQNDLLIIYRQVRNTKIKSQIRNFLLGIDEQQGINSDIDNVKISKIEKLKQERNIIKYNIEKNIMV